MHICQFIPFLCVCVCVCVCASLKNPQCPRLGGALRLGSQSLDGEPSDRAPKSGCHALKGRFSQQWFSFNAQALRPKKLLMEN